MATAGSLFTGIAGIDLAFALAGFDILFQVEIDDFCQKVIKKHSQEYWPNAKIFTDVRGVGRHNLPSVDVLFGGFPCQDLSGAGKRAGLVAGKRSSLWFEFARIIGEIRPRIVLLENVSGITAPRKEKNGDIHPADMGLVIDSLSSMGYSARWGIISAADAGAPHQRNRWFCMAYAERRGLSKQESSRGFAHNIEWNAKAEQFAGRALTSEAVADREILRDANTVAYTDSERFNQNGEYRIEEGERLSGSSSLGYPYGKRLQRGYRAKQRARQFAAPVGRQGRKAGKSLKSALGRDAYGVSERLDGSRLMAHRWPNTPDKEAGRHEPPRLIGSTPNRRKEIQAFGNAVCPQSVYPIALEIKKLLETV